VRAGVTPELARIERVFAASKWPWRRAVRGSREHALTLLRGSESDEGAVRVASHAHAVDMLCALAVELVARPADAAELVDELERSVGLSRLALGRDVLRSPELVRLPPAVAAEVQLGLLAIFAPVREASLWVSDDAGFVRCVRRVGGDAEAAGESTFAERLLSGRPDPASRQRPFIGLPVTRWQRPVAALVARAERGARDRARAFLTEAVPNLVTVLERDDLLARNAAAERALRAPGERRLSRLGLDLHDGPLQDLAVLGEDLRVLRRELKRRLASAADRNTASASLDDIDARVLAIEVDLRHVSASVQVPAMLHQTFAVAVRKTADGFAARTGVKPRVRLRGDLAALGSRAELALLAVIREALNNVRSHGRASEVDISVVVRSDRIEAEVRDDGRGFDVERTLVRAARSGHLGLAGLHERVRSLDGEARIDSAPGGPTTISVVLPRVEPVAALGEDATA
jgi:signal transduction histidine kinase